jgi:ABC-type Mn2+/Zn2+ transport system ATPase subunit
MNPVDDVLLTARDLAVGYRGVTILDGVDLTIRRGECVAVVGANGSGKTTLFRTLAGILSPLAGGVTLHAPAGSRARLTIGYVPQRDQLEATFPLTVAEIVRMGAYRRWRPFVPLREAGPDHVLAALSKVGAGGWERRTLSELSGGQRQRVLIARALITEPALLFLDEPTSGIDRVSEEAIYAELCRCRSAGLGIVMVSHDLVGLMQVATRALVIENARLTEIPVTELLAPRRSLGTP